jgi:hypothetical protein
MDITDKFNLFREAARHLWNTYFHLDAEKNNNWDLRDAFSEVYVSLFNAIIKYHLPDSVNSIPHLYDPEQNVLNEYRIIGRSETIPIWINRTKPASGYWDYPIKVVQNDTTDLRLISIFDFDNLGFRDFGYFRVRIVRSNEMDLEGRDALVEVKYCKVLFDDSVIKDKAS